MSTVVLTGTENPGSSITYEVPRIELSGDDHVVVNEAYWAALGFVIAYWGSAWAWCWAVCWGRPKSCDVKWWGAVRAECY